MIRFIRQNRVKIDMTNDLRAGIEEVLRKDIELGMEVIRSPYGDYRKPARIDVTGARFMGPYFNRLRAEDDYKGTLDLLLEGVKSLDSYIGNQFDSQGKRWFNPNLKVEMPEKEEDFFKPELPSFSKNPLIVIKPVRDLGDAYQVDGNVFHTTELPIGETFVFAGGHAESLGALTHEFNFKNLGYRYSRPVFSNRQPHRLDIKGAKIGGITQARFIIDFSRFPIVLNLDMENRHSLLQKYASSIYQTLIIQLEPFAEVHMLRECEKIGYNITQEQFDKISKTERRDLQVLTTAVIREWLYIQGKFSRKEIDDLGSKTANGDASNLALNQIGLRGPFESIHFYSSASWNLGDFLKGNF